MTFEDTHRYRFLSSFAKQKHIIPESDRLGGLAGCFHQVPATTRFNVARGRELALIFTPNEVIFLLFID
jgi:hypothetical protein